MKVIMFGTDLCGDCVAAKAELATVTDKIELDFRDITKSTATLKEFLSFRDHDPLFAPVITAGGIGIPFFIVDNQTRTFEIGDFLGEVVLAPTGSACSVDKKGC